MDYYSEEERPRQKAMMAWRDRRLAPLVERLAKWGVTPNHITFLGLGLLIAALAVGPLAPWITTALIVLYCLLDGLDGPLARKTGKSSEGGALFDVVADQAGVVGVSAMAVHYLDTNGALAVIFSSFYLAVIALILHARHKGMPIRPVIRIKYVAYGGFCVSLILEKDILTGILAYFGPYYVLMFCWLFLDLYRHITPDPGRRSGFPAGDDH